MDGQPLKLQKPLKLARPEGLEPPTFRFEVYHGAQREVIREKETSRKQEFMGFGYGPFPPLSHHFGNNLETTSVGLMRQSPF